MLTYSKVYLGDRKVRAIQVQVNAVDVPQDTLVHHHVLHHQRTVGQQEGESRAGGWGKKEASGRGRRGGGFAIGLQYSHSHVDTAMCMILLVEQLYKTILLPHSAGMAPQEA